jgi:hypothetical protein
MHKRVGLLMGHHRDVERALVSRLAGEPGVSVEPMVIGGISEQHIGRYDVIVDGFSAHVPHYRHVLRACALGGASVLNDPFYDDDRFFALSLAARQSIDVARAVLLPQHSYGPSVDHGQSLGALEHPLRWQAIVDYVKFPAWLRAVDRGLETATRIDSLDGMWAAFNASGAAVTMLQQYFDIDSHVSVLHCDSQVEDPRVPRPIRARAAELAATMGLAWSRTTWALRGGKCWLVDGPDPAPSPADLDEQALDDLAAATLAALRSGHRTRDGHRWGRAFDR